MSLLSGSKSSNPIRNQQRREFSEKFKEVRRECSSKSGYFQSINADEKMLHSASHKNQVAEIALMKEAITKNKPFTLENLNQFVDMFNQINGTEWKTKTISQSIFNGLVVYHNFGENSPAFIFKQKDGLFVCSSFVLSL
ncbi:hypothetical protein [Vibrio parahaemolyticus]|uniref:hypothetical protein n=1 Tax=Vibrio parahaemolyticus TaxID=670 RepID=UPI001DACA3D2|nr:hypothetical protein [Vibrio parahaemolyticus]EJC6974842.1 hypothetical protein [Vibrio parahaemolyticus]EJC7127731.1 hypothetical protein [Vibrio parahaemolyticus]EJG1091270.1 hypothetical protein [Vibrio parahaemolyticus]MDF4677073.1 hypothetical protein [Vibrio parahaemolyticus]